MNLFKLLLVLVFAFPALAHAEALRGVDPLKESELSELCGGFTLPNGINLNVGIDNVVSLNGTIIANSTLSLNGNIVSTNSTGTTQIQGNGGLTTVQLSPAGTAIITNTASNIALSQIRTITVDLNNVSRQSLQSIGSFANIQSQALNGLRNGLH